MATGDPSAWNGLCTSQLNVVLLGGRNSGKSSVGNLLLGKEEFMAKERTTCSRRLAVVSGCRLTVVDTPGWWCDFSAQDTCELVKREIRSSVSLCSPGPHVFLIAVKLSSAFSERRRRAVEEHVALLGERAWGHCVLVFTSADVAGCGKVLLEHVRRLGERCGGGSQAVNLSDGSGAAELLGKIQELVRENGNRVFELEGDILQAVTEERRSVEERARRRLMRGRQHRALTQEKLRPVTDIRMVLLGAKGSGKTSVLRTILGPDRGAAQPLGRTARSAAETGVVFGRRVTVVDTPGWWMNYFCDESTALDLRELVRGLSLCPPGPHVFLLVVRLDRAFTETYWRAVQEHVRLIGERIWDRTVLLLTFGDWLGGTGAELYVEGEGIPLRWLADRCGDRFHVLDNTSGGGGFQVRELIQKIETMLAGGSERYYEIEKGVLEQMEERGRRENERAKERRMKKESRRQMARIQLKKLDLLPEIRLVLVGGRKCGKSSCGNTILGRKCFDADAPLTSHAENQGRIGDRTVTVVDTPECFSVTSDLLGPPSACAVLLVVNVSSSFRDKHREDLEKQLEGGGGEVWSRSMVLFSHGDWLGSTSVEQRIESEGEALHVLVERCGDRYHVLNNRKPGDGAQVDELMELVEEMLAADRAEGGADHMRGSVPKDGVLEPDSETPKHFKVSCDSCE